MSDLKNLIERPGEGLLWMDGLRIEKYQNGVLNIIERDHTLTRPRLDQFRKALTEAGYREKESWVASQGASWLSTGVFAGVSMRVEALK